MSFSDAKESFFLDAVSITSPPVVQILPLTDTEVFEYLDAHPDALARYLEERSVLSEYFGRTLAQNQDTHSEPAFENLDHGEEEEEDNEDDGDDDDNSERDDDRDSDCHGDEHGSESYDESDDGNDCVSDIDEDNKAIFNEMSSEAGPGTPSNTNTHSPFSNPSADEVEDNHDADEDEHKEELMPYPAPAHLVAASRRGPPTRSWALWEEEACIRHMLDINGERRLQGEARFREALRRMQLFDGVRRTGHSAVKNFWNRVGRARSNFDERRNKKAPLATSKQGKRDKRTPSSNTKSRETRRQRTPECSSDEDESDYSIQSDNEEPGQLRNTRKRKGRDDDSDDDWEPGTAAANATTGGSRPSQRVRVG